jgi:hypothetical protein
MPICRSQLGCHKCQNKHVGIICKAYYQEGLNVSQQTTFMVQTFCFGGTHHHKNLGQYNTIIKTIVPQKYFHPLGEVWHGKIIPKEPTIIEIACVNFINPLINNGFQQNACPNHGNMPPMSTNYSPK